jgi:hypothetical protein
MPILTSPMISAIDLERSDIAVMTFEELEAHAVQVLNTIAALNDHVNRRGAMSANERQNARRLARKLSVHMAKVRDLITAGIALAAVVQSSCVQNQPIGTGLGP